MAVWEGVLHSYCLSELWSLFCTFSVDWGVGEDGKYFVHFECFAELFVFIVARSTSCYIQKLIAVTPAKKNKDQYHVILIETPVAFKQGRRNCLL